MVVLPSAQNVTCLSFLCLHLELYFDIGIVWLMDKEVIQQGVEVVVISKVIKHLFIFFRVRHPLVKFTLP